MGNNAIMDGVRACLAEALDIPPESIQPEHKIIDDLGADSLDLLDLIFRLEQSFDIRISPGDIERRAREELGDKPLEINGAYTPEALAQLRQALPEVPAAELQEGLMTNQLPRLFRVATFVNIVSRLKEESHA